MGNGSKLQHSPSSGTRSILVIRLSAMGDVAMTVPVLIALTERYSEIRITVLTKAFLAPIFSQIPNVTVYTADVKGKHKGGFGLWKLYKELKSKKIELVADLHSVLRSTILKQFFRLDKIPFVQIDKGRAEKKALTAENNKIFTPLKSSHERYADVFRNLGFQIDLNKSHVLSRQPLSSQIQEIVGNESIKWIGIAPFAAFAGKMYPVELMERVLSQLNNTEKYKIILFGGGEKELEKLEEWESLFSNVVNSAGKLSFSDELALISNLDTMLAMDSGNAHLAAMYGIPTITLWGVTHPYAGFYPFGQDMENALLADREQFPLIPTSVYGNKFPVGYEHAMETIAPEQIVKKIEAILSK